MQKNFTNVAVSLIGAVAASMATLPTPGYATQSTLQEIPIVDQSITQETATKEVAPEKPKENRLICKDCNDYEARALAFFQDRGITDKNAIATIMGNIKQESGFVPNVCQGGSRTSYRGCRSGGFGLIQFTDSQRYNGLGQFASRIGGDPSSLDTQLNYIITEPQWMNIENKLKTPGKSINDYMGLAYNWIGWGIHGSRTYYAREYAKRFQLV
jgi:hypothetical protein